jgi:hypothetical protein
MNEPVWLPMTGGPRTYKVPSVMDSIGQAKGDKKLTTSDG